MLMVPETAHLNSMDINSVVGPLDSGVTSLANNLAAYNFCRPASVGLSGHQHQDESTLYVAPLDVTRRTKLDADWGLDGTTLKVDITLWCLMPSKSVSALILDILRSKDSKAGEVWKLHHAFDSNNIHELGFLFEDTKRRDNVLKVLGKDGIPLWCTVCQPPHLYRSPR